MEEKITRFAAVFMALLVVLLPVSFVEALQISGTKVSETTGNSATIEWQTDFPSSSTVYYGTSAQEAEDALTSKSSSDLEIDHSITIENLQPETWHYYQVHSISVEEGDAVDDNSGSFYRFFTTDEPDAEPPVISDIRVEGSTASASIVTWKTDEPATSKVFVAQRGTDPAEAGSSSSFSETHSVTVAAVEGREYEYYVESCDMLENCAQSETRYFIGGLDTSPPEINADIPSWHNSGRITIEGTTEPYSEVELYVNNQLSRALSPDATQGGTIRFLNVNLPEPENGIRIEAEDQAGNKASREYNVRIDEIPPTLQVSDIPDVVSRGSLRLTVSTDEPCDITFVSKLSDDIAPAPVSGLEKTSVSDAGIRLSWSDNSESDISGYAVYRSFDSEPYKRIAITSSNTYTDENAGGRTYSYRVSAIDFSCNEGMKSETVSVQAPSDASRHSEPDEPEITCEENKEVLSRDGGEFVYNINLKEGTNDLLISAVDRAGNKAEVKASTVFDLYPPEIIESNLQELSPAYIPTVTVKGIVSEPANVVAFVNGKAVENTDTDAEGNFQMTIELSKDDSLLNLQGAGTSAGSGFLSLAYDPASSSAGNHGPVWTNKVKLVATDLSGSQSRAEEADVKLTTCGLGGEFRIDIGGQPGSIFGTDAVSPSILNPRMMIEGTEIISFPINLTYVGAGDADIARIPSVRKYTPTPSMRDLYEPDYDWVQDPTIICDPVTGKTCFVQMRVKVPDSYFEGKFPGVEPDDITMFMKEELLSRNRKDIEGTGGCISSQSGIDIGGCIKVPLLLEFEYRKVTPAPQGAYADTHQPGQPVVNARFQKECWELDLAIDTRIPPDKLPGGLLRGSQEFLQQSIDIIDSVLEPVKTIKEYLFWSCIASWVFSFFFTVNYYLSCSEEFAMIESGGDGRFDPKIAELGVCELEYEEEALENCESCQDSVNMKARLEWLMHHACDSIFCPSAPTLQKYVRQQSSKSPEAVKGSSGTIYYLGSSCACQLDNPLECEPIGGNERVDTGFEAMKRVYEWYSQSPDKNSFSSGIGTEKCIGAHTARPECCGFEYMAGWGSACGFPLSDEAMFSEIKESICLAAQATNQPSTISGLQLSATGDSTDSVECYPLLNSIAGFCEPDGKQMIDPLPTGSDVNPSAVSNAGGPTIDKDDKGLYVCIFPPGSLENDKRKVSFCYPTTKSRVVEKQNVEEDFIPIQKDFGFYTPSGWDVTQAFDTGGDKAAENRGKRIFCSKMAEVGIRNSNCEDRYYDVLSALGDPNKEYVVDPTSSLIRSMQCLCISGIDGYLSLWKKVFTALLNCFKAIELTGDGSPGVCQATVSVYVCDLIFDVIKCFAQKYSTGSTRGDGDALSGFIGVLSKSGSDVSSSVQGRYGATPLWHAMFVEQKLMHAVCLWAFTGVWDVDMSALLESDTASAPIESIGFISPCEMRYRAFNPTTDPPGLTTWMYRLGVGIVPGADLRYNLKLVCSNGYSCSEMDGFENGKCDCSGEEKVLTVTDTALRGTLRKSDLLDEEIFYLAENSGYRYDKAVLEWTWKDNNGNQRTDSVDCRLNLRGGSPPAFCGFDLLYMSYRCKFGFETDNWIRFNSASPRYPSGQPAFKLGDPLTFVVDVQQAIPSNPDCTTGECDYTKYMTYRITRGNSVILSSDDTTNTNPAKELKTSGQSIITDFPSNVVVNQESMFTSLGPQSSVYPCMRGTPPEGTGQPTCAPYSCASTCTGSFGVSITGSSGEAQHVVLAMDQTNLQFFVPKSTTPRQSVENPSFENTYFEKDSSKQSSPKMQFGSQTPFSIGGITFSVTGRVPRRHTEILFIYNPQKDSEGQTGNNLCNRYDTFEEAKALPFIMTYEIWDSRQIGGQYERSDQIAQYQGSDLRMDVPFYIVCNDNIISEGVDLSRQCSHRSTSPETRDCWCSNELRQASTTDPANTPFDVSADGPNKYCVDDVPSSIPACITNKKLESKCICAYNNNIEITCNSEEICQNRVCVQNNNQEQSQTSTNEQENCPTDNVNIPLESDCKCGDFKCKQGQVCDSDYLYKPFDSIFVSDDSQCIKKPICNPDSVSGGLSVYITEETGDCFCLPEQPPSSSITPVIGECTSGQYCLSNGECSGQP